MNEPASVYILLGSNVGDRHKALKTAYLQLQDHVGQIVKSSSIYKTDAWGKEDQASFYNQVIIVHTKLSALSVLKKSQSIEQAMGRVRLEKWKERIIDIDILYYNQKTITLPELQIPHPYLHKRRFTLVPLVEITPDFVHPVLQKTQKKLLMDCQDTLNVQRIEP